MTTPAAAREQPPRRGSRAGRARQNNRAGWARPCRPWGSIPGAMVVTAIWWLVAHTSGQGWVQALGDLVFGGLVVGVLGPWLAVRRATATVVSCPADAVAGQPVILEIRRSRPLRVSARLPGDRRRPGPGTDGDEITVVPFRRGVHRHVRLEVSTAAPFGLQWWSRRIEVDLPRTLYVAPAVGSRRRPPLPADTGQQDEGISPRRSLSGDLRGSRPYVPGDGRSLVHWPATAHTGILMVRELGTPNGPPVEVEVVLPADETEAEAAAGAALGEVLDLVDQGRTVLLTTDEADGRRRGPVDDARMARRRLAAAASRQP